MGSRETFKEILCFTQFVIHFKDLHFNLSVRIQLKLNCNSVGGGLAIVGYSQLSIDANI